MVVETPVSEGSRRKPSSLPMSAAAFPCQGTILVNRANTGLPVELGPYSWATTEVRVDGRQSMVHSRAAAEHDGRASDLWLGTAGVAK